MKLLKKIKTIIYQLALTLWLFPLTVQAQAFAPADTILQRIIDAFTSTTGRLIAIVAVIGLGLSALFGIINMKMAGGIVGGIALIFGATALVDAFWT